MCGIVGYVGGADAVLVLTPALKRLEYRGYDSAGMATVNGRGLEVRKAAGKIAQLESLLSADRPSGHIGIAHTRWATHGRPTEANAHPHVDCHGRIAVVHNGIIENHEALRTSLAAEGHVFRSETDTEVIAHLVERDLSMGLAEAVRRAVSQLRGSFAVACVSDAFPDELVAARGGSAPLVLARGEGEAFLASDLVSLLDASRETLLLDSGEVAVLTSAGITLRRFDGEVVERAPVVVERDLEAIEKNGYSTFMLKEIHEQPQAIRHALMDRIDSRGEPDLHETGLTGRDLAQLSRVSFIACGTSWNAGLAGKYLVERLACLPADVEIASECRHRRPIYDARGLVVPISQSGETADTIVALRQARAGVTRTMAICNVPGSSIAREADGLLATRAGLEIGVAATKSFTTQLVAVTLLALAIGRVRGWVDRREARSIGRDLLAAPDLIADLLAREDEIRAVAERCATKSGALYLGRGLQYPLALEGALKLKEIAYLHAEGYAAGEMKHGPIALVDRDLLAVALAPAGPTRTPMMSNIQEIKARDGAVFVLATSGDEAAARLADEICVIPPASACVQPLLLAVVLQLFAYHVAMIRGCDVDQPRNLAKSVTVE